MLIPPKEFTEKDCQKLKEHKEFKLLKKGNNYMVIIILQDKSYVLSEDFIEENSIKDFDYLKQIQTRNITEIEDYMFKKIKNHEQASQYIVEYSTKLNEFKKKKNPSLAKEIKELDSALSKYFQKMEKKKFQEQETKYVNKLKKTFEDLRNLKNSLQLDEDIWKEPEKQSTTRMKQAQVQQQQVVKPIVDTWTKNSVDVEKQIALETRNELIKMESEFNEISEMIQDFNQITKEQDKIIKDIKKNVHESNANVQQGVKELKEAKKYQRFGLG